uniref:ZP domain-containing protein n=1 Tax=Steinernema glaseri TaxID=37863 RepID=A0A1I7Z8E6_9BILA
MSTFRSASALFSLALITIGSVVIRAIPVDNNVEGEPEITCGADAIEINFKTRNPFNGRLYVKGRFDNGDCRNEQVGRKFTGITLNFECVALPGYAPLTLEESLPAPPSSSRSIRSL